MTTLTPYNIAIGSIFTECNQLGGSPIDLSWFERYQLSEGPDLLATKTGVLGGMLETLAENKANPIPLLYASTTPGGLITPQCYAKLKARLLRYLEKAENIDGVLLPLHGAAAVDDVDDLEGDLIRAVRNLVGPDIPIVVTLDLHAHVTADMVHHSDAILAWETYPHEDAFSTGQRGAKLLMAILNGECNPTMAMVKVPVITGAIHGSTKGDDPFAVVMRQIKAYEQDEDVVSTSLFLVHPYLDQPDMGSGALVVTNNNLEKAKTIAQNIADQYWVHRFALEPDTYSPEESIARGLTSEDKPILLVETADCCGGGAAGDSVATLKALLASNVAQKVLVLVVDPQAAQQCHQAGLDKTVSVMLGHSLDKAWGKPIQVTGLVSELSQGNFQYHGGIWDGVEGDMGLSAVLTVGTIHILIMSYATYEWMDEQYKAVGLAPSEAKFVVVKNPMNYQIAYRDIAQATYILDTPGPTPATIRNSRHHRLPRPCFPLDPDVQSYTPLLLTNPET